MSQLSYDPPADAIRQTPPAAPTVQCRDCRRWVETGRKHICEPPPASGGKRTTYTEPVRYETSKGEK